MDPIASYLAANEPRFVADLIAYARYPSVSAQPKHAGDLAACAGWIADRCRAIGLNGRSAALDACDGN